MTDAPPATTWRLRGRVDHTERTFHLDLGEHQVGSLPSNAVVLPVRGVSRRHARLEARSDALHVEDLGSRNGTYLDERQVERAPAGDGAELRFGSVRLRLERLAPADAEMAIVLETAEPVPDHRSPAPRTLGETTLLESTSEPAAPSLELVFPEGYLPLDSPAMAALYRQAEALSRSALPVLITGETGVGKELIAQTLHRSSQRSAGPFLAVNCAAIPAELLEAEMFGIGRGVATGVEQRRGKFELAQSGTLFLDEVGEMVPALQAKLLRALQEKEIHPVGGLPKRVDVRVVAATNADLQEKMAGGTFRRDLYYRLAGSVLEVPPLRLLRDDIPRLVEHFLRRFCREAGRKVRGLTVGALDLLTSFAWPGNVRQLENEIRRLVYQSHSGQTLDSASLSAEIRAVPPSLPSPSIPLDPLTLEPRLRELEVCLIREALKRTGGNQTQAARLLGITRNGLAKKRKRLEI